MNKKKTELTHEQVKTFLQRQFANKIEKVQPIVEGEESQAFSYKCGGKAYILRINRGSAGFQKDAYVAQHFHSQKLPIPRVIQVGYIDEGHAFCVAEKRPGFTLQDADPQTMRQLLEPTLQAWRALQECDLSNTTGFGDFDADGQGIYVTWREFLLSIFDALVYDWDLVASFMDQTIYEHLITNFTFLVKFCPEERSLVHGDFGSNNVLTDGQTITAVLDWENAKYGDPLFDIAIAYFWSPWLDCMAAQAAYYEVILSMLPGYHERLICYQLRIGLDEIYDTIIHQNWKMAQWAIKRSIEIAPYKYE